jgi:signal transduction histidine kinase
LTIASVLIAALLCTLGFSLTLGRAGPAIGGAVTGAAIGTMHYVGMAAVRAPADALWDWRYVVSSCVIGIGMMAYGMDFTVRRNNFSAYAIGAVVFTLAICSMHFTGMSAVVYRFDPLVSVPDIVMDPAVLALAIGAAAVLIVALGLIGAVVDGHLAARERNEAVRLRAHIVELEATKSQLEETSQHLMIARDAAHEANRSKSAFLAAMSHELRTPLNAVIGFSEMMTAEAFGPLGAKKYHEYAADIRASGTHLLSLINDILDLSRIDAGEGKLDEGDTDLRDVIAQSLRMMAHQAEAAGVALTSEIAPGLPSFRADKRRLKQTLINLLGNAIKFTGAQGSITVRAWSENGGAKISVADTGIGIAAHDIPRALERFGQVDSSLARKYEGAGLGLPLAKHFMEMHGGSLSLESTPGIGTTVTVSLPAARALPAASVAA